MAANDKSGASGSGATASPGSETGDMDAARLAKLLKRLKHFKRYKRHHHCEPPWPGPWWPGPWWPGPISAAMCESWLQWAAARASFRRRWWNSMADAAYQARRGYDWCEPGWCEPDCWPDWCWPDPCFDTEAVDIKKLKEALVDKLGKEEGEKEFNNVLHAIRLARSLQAMKSKRWSRHHGDDD